MMKTRTAAFVCAGLVSMAGLGYPGAQEVVAADTTAGSAAGATRITHVDAAKAKQLVADKSILVLDIRTPREFRSGHIAGAKNLNFLSRDFPRQLAKLEKTRKYLVYCASGGRSTGSLKQFQQLKFKSVVHLDGGIRAWKRAGFSLEK